MAEYISVSALNHLAGAVLAQCEPLNNLIVCGEISGFVRHYKSGHCYFTLKDEKASVKTVLFREKSRLINFEPEDGMMVLAYGHATIYERDGAFQFYADYLKPFGAGAAQMAFDRLKMKLEKEGLFAHEHKKPLPERPACIGVVTSRNGAALQDVINVISRRWPLTKLLIAPVSVQGLAAESSIVAGIRALDDRADVDEILITRGGGSREDLWVFNSERIARAAYACHKPVISAVGHEIDTTILDYVADLRAPTPSAAAELCVPDKARVQEQIFILSKNIQKNMQSIWQVCYNTFGVLNPQAILTGQRVGLARRQASLLQTQQDLKQAVHQKIAADNAQMHHSAELAASLNPYEVLARGYAMVHGTDGQVCGVEELKAGQTILLEGSGAKATCVVKDTEKKTSVREERL